MSKEFEGFSNDFFDFENTDNFLDSISGSRVGDNGSGNDNWNYGDAEDSNFAQQLTSEDYDQPRNHSLFSYASSDSTSKGEDLTPESQPSMSSSHTTPEPSKSISSESDDDRPRKKTVSAKNKVVKPKRDKVSHNMIEKKYRTNINSKILQLRDVVPSLRIASGSKDVSISDLEGLTPASKLNKASVLTKAIEYIKHLEGKNDALYQQNLQLQRLIQRANASQYPSDICPPVSTNSSSINSIANGSLSMNYSDHMNMPNMANSMSGSISGNSNLSDLPMQSNLYYQNGDMNQRQAPNKYLLGGMAAVMGTSLLGGPDSDFRGLSAIPIIPFSIPQSVLLTQFWYVVKLLMFFSCIGLLIVPELFNPSTKKAHDSLFTDWALVGFGFKLPKKVDEGKKQRILNGLLGKSGYTFSQQVGDYMYLSSCETNFETCFLNLMLGVILIKRYPILSKVLSLNMNLKYSLILNLDSKDTKSLGQLNHLIRKLDGVSLFHSDVITRVINMINGRPVCEGLESMSNLKYIELSKGSDFYNIVFSWRLLEIIDALNVVYLQNLTIEDEEELLEKNNKLFKDIKLIDNLLKDDVEIGKYFNKFKTVVLSRENAMILMNKVKQEVEENLNKVRIVEEFSDEGEFSESADSDSEYESDIESGKLELNSTRKVNSDKALINSLRLVDQNDFIIIACSIITYYYNKGHKLESFKLLKHFESIDFDNLTIFSFTSLFKAINLLITKENLEEKELEEHSSTLDELIKVTRLWLSNKKNVLNEELRENLSDSIVSRGILLNGGDEIS